MDPVGALADDPKGVAAREPRRRDLALRSDEAQVAALLDRGVQVVLA